MKTRIFQIGSVFLFFFFSFSVERALALRCGSQIVSPGDPRWEVREKCGKPAWIEERTEEHVQETRKGTHRRFIHTEEWIYNFGPSEFIRVLLFNDGKLINIETRGYGFSPDAPSVPDCDRAVVSLGDTKLEVKMKCGEPVSAEVRMEELVFESESGFEQIVPIVFEEWTYDFGPNRLTQIYRFKNGRLIAVQTGQVFGH
jgi:hypothetical protein